MADKQISTGLASGYTKAQQAAPFICAAFIFAVSLALPLMAGCVGLSQEGAVPLYRYANLHSLPPYWRREI